MARIHGDHRVGLSEAPFGDVFFHPKEFRASLRELHDERELISGFDGGHLRVRESHSDFVDICLRLARFLLQLHVRDDVGRAFDEVRS